MSIVAKKKANEFVRKYKFLKPDLKRLREIIKSQGYMIIEFNGIKDDENVENVIRTLALTEQVKYTRAFTYANESVRLVFVNEDLSEEEKLTVLLHEEGHIFCGHMEKASVLGEDVLQEEEANEFAHYVKRDNWKKRICRAKVPLICTLLALCIIFLTTALMLKARNDALYYNDYYVTKTGERYHVKDCRFIENGKNTERMTKEDYESGRYKPCKVCIEDGD